MRGLTTLLIFVLAAAGCRDGQTGSPLAPESVDHVEAVIAGQVTDPSGAPIELATVVVAIECPPPYDGCSRGTSVYTFADGRFTARFEIGLQTSFPFRARLHVEPPLGMGYVMSDVVIEELPGTFQPPPVADTLAVRISLPPNEVDSRRPVRVQDVGHRSGDFRVGDEVFFFSGFTGVVALDPRTGEGVWERGGLGGLSGPGYALVGDRVAIAGIGSLFAVRVSDGEVLWSREAVANRSLTAGGPDGLFASDGASVVSYDPVTGSTRWRRELIGIGNVALAAGPGLVCAEILAYVECWEPLSGQPVWSRPTDFAAWLEIAGGRVLLGTSTGWTALEASTGDVAWIDDVGPGPPPVISSDGRVAFRCALSACAAIRTEDGGISWRTDFPDEVSAPGVEGGSLYVTVGLGPLSRVHEIAAESGAIRERILPDPFGDGFCGTPVVAADWLFVSGCFGALYTFERHP